MVDYFAVAAYNDKDGIAGARQTTDRRTAEFGHQEEK